MAKKIDRARRFANNFLLKHGFYMSEDEAELFAKSILQFEQAAQKSIDTSGMTTAQIKNKRRKVAKIALPEISQ